MRIRSRRHPSWTQTNRAIYARIFTAANIRADVVDTGPGLPATVKNRLFEPFTTTKADGLGIGLFISCSIIEAHDGTLWAEENPGGGTVFSFVLPVTRA